MSNIHSILNNFKKIITVWDLEKRKRISTSDCGPDLWSSGSITILAQIIWLVLILIAPESSGEYFLCGSGEQIPIEWVNDGDIDCWDGSDES